MTDPIVIWAQQALLPSGWARDVAVTIRAGRIADVTPGAQAQGHRIGALLPAPTNLHSHAFQRAMAGLTEARGPDAGDSFWTWRRLMFRFLQALTPDQVAAIAAMVQMEMAEAGFGACVEFHYLHHQPDGTPYPALAEMAGRIAEAATQSGLGLTLLPVHYQFGGCDGRPLGPGQIRFGTDPDLFALLHEASRAAIAALPEDTALGVAPHSLRAVSPAGLAQVAGLGGPVHIHAAEQLAEVAEVAHHLGTRPVRWLLDMAPVGPGWCLIHATQMDPTETTGLARSGAVAGLCPITEANLGDGVFDAVRYLRAGGRIGVGSDSNLRISLAEELRQLDHSQRLRDHSRAALATAELSTGRRLWQAAADGGARAAGRDSGAIAPGHWADLAALDTDAPDLAGLSGDRLIDAFAFADPVGRVRDLWSAGRHVVRDGRHIHRDAIVARYIRAVQDLRASA